MPPLVLQPLVENAVTHGVAHLIEGGIVRIRVTAQRPRRLTSPSIIRAIRDGRPGAGPAWACRTCASGFERLYGTEAALRTDEADGRFTVRLDLPIETEQTTPAQTDQIHARMEL